MDKRKISKARKKLKQAGYHRVDFVPLLRVFRHRDTGDARRIAVDGRIIKAPKQYQSSPSPKPREMWN